MRKLIYHISLMTLGIFLMLLYGGCDKSVDPATTSTSSSSTTSSCCPFATLSGTGSLPPGVVGDIQNTRVALFISVEDWNLGRAIALTACDGSGNYTMSSMLPGVYYMDAWKDNDNDGIWGSSGDYVWVYGSEVWPNPTLSAIQIPIQLTVDFELFVVP